MLNLRKIEEKDTDFVLSLHNSERGLFYFPRKAIITKEQHLNFLKHIENKGDLYFIIEWDTTPAGTVSIYDIDKANKHAEWGRFIIKEEYPSLGFSVEKKIIDIAKNDLKLHKLFCQVMSHNERLIKFHHLLGFQTEGVLKDHIYHNDRYTDLHQLSIIFSENI